ncbi:MAG: hypothetical protein WDN00_11875 [Limisphaerales bacterium]
MKSFQKQFAVALLAILAVSAISMGCEKSHTENAKDDIKDAANKTGDAIKEGAGAVKDAVTNAVDNITNTNK